MDDLIFASVKDLAQTIQAKEISSNEIVKACLQRINVVNANLNAVVQLTPDMALEQAREAERPSPGGISRGLCMASPLQLRIRLK